MEIPGLLRELVALKELVRAGWVRVGVSDPESVADHSFGVAFAALVLCPPELNREKVLMMALLHDVAEVRVGDITPHDGVSKEEKKRREYAAIEKILAGYPELLALFYESEAQQTAEARFVKSMDRLDLVLTAQHYAKTGVDTSEFLIEK